MSQPQEDIFSKQKNAIQALVRGSDSKAKKRSKLNQTIKELKELCDHFDPYKGANDLQKETLKKYHIISDSDPFLITNQLLVLIEDALEEREKLG